MALSLTIGFGDHMITAFLPFESKVIKQINLLFLLIMGSSMSNFKFNGAHMDDKKALTVGQLQTLADAKYLDISWGSNECASFGSDCLRYELFVNIRTDNVSDQFHAVHYDDDGGSTFFHSGDNLAQCLAVIESYKRGLL